MEDLSWMGNAIHLKSKPNPKVWEFVRVFNGWSKYFNKGNNSVEAFFKLPPVKTKKVKIPVPLEKVIHRQVCTWLKAQHPNIAFHSDFAAAARMTVGQIMANKAIQSENSWSDLFIALPIIQSRLTNIGMMVKYCGLFIEIKREYSAVYKADGSFVKSEHIAAQNDFLIKMRNLGFAARFGCGFDHCIMIITDYLNGQKV